jgi:hypothetical protein
MAHNIKIHFVIVQNNVTEENTSSIIVPMKRQWIRLQAPSSSTERKMHREVLN